MSKLEELIQGLCPDGVEDLDISEVTSVERGIRVVKNQLTETGDYPVYQNSLKPLGYHMQSNCSRGTAFVIGAGAAGEIGYSEVDFWAADDCYYFQQSAKLDSRYLYYVLLSKQHFLFSKVRKASIPRLSRSVIQHLQIPIPPLEVQQEIVRILDRFTEHTAEYTAELTAELTARKQQFEYYRSIILSNSDVAEKKLGDIVSVFRGEYITKKDTKAGRIPVILGGQEPAYFIDHANHTGEVVVIARSGASAGFVSYWNKPIFITDGFGYEAKQEIIMPKYLYYILKNNEPKLNSMKRGAGVPHVSGETLLSITVPVPPLSKQQEIVSILDHFETLCNNLSNGLSAEIEARQKQYEYYRNKLLTFKRLA